VSPCLWPAVFSSHRYAPSFFFSMGVTRHLLICCMARYLCVSMFITRYFFVIIDATHYLCFRACDSFCVFPWTWPVVCVSMHIPCSLRVPWLCMTPYLCVCMNMGIYLCISVDVTRYVSGLIIAVSYVIPWTWLLFVYSCVISYWLPLFRFNYSVFQFRFECNVFH
jgi:hypothetical protein